jgi:hypothetical protein
MKPPPTIRTIPGEARTLRSARRQAVPETRPHPAEGPRRAQARVSAGVRTVRAAQGACRFDGLGPAVDAELGVQVAHVGLDGVRRHGQLAGNLRRRQVRRQVAQYADLAVAQRLERRPRLTGRRRGPFPGQQVEDLGQQRGVRGALPGVALEHARCRVQQEPQERAVGFGQIQRSLHSPVGRGLVTERIPSNGLQQEGLNCPGSPADSGGAVQDRLERHGRRVRIVLGEPQRRGGDTHLATVAVGVADVGKNLLGLLGPAEAHQGVQEPCPHRPGERVRRGQVPGQPLGGPERGQRIGVPPEGQLHLAARVLDSHRRHGRGFRSDRALGAPHPGRCLLRPPLPGQRGSERHVGEASRRLVGPAVPPGQLDRLPAPFCGPRKPPRELDLRPVHEADELEIGPPDPARQRDPLLQVELCLVEPTGPDLRVGQADQGQRAQLLAQSRLRHVRGSARRLQPLCLLGYRRQVALVPRQQ